MAEAGVGAIIEFMLGELLTLAAEEISLFRHFKDELKKLQGSLTFVQAFLLDAEKKQVTDGAVKVWLRQLEDLAFDADNVVDEIDYELLSKKAKPTENNTVNEKRSEKQCMVSEESVHALPINECTFNPIKISLLSKK